MFFFRNSVSDVLEVGITPDLILRKVHMPKVILQQKIKKSVDRSSLPSFLKMGGWADPGKLSAILGQKSIQNRSKFHFDRSPWFLDRFP